MKLFRSFSWIFIANLIVSACKWLVLVIIANLLTPEDVGAYSLALAVGAPITLFANMKMRSLFITEDKNNFNEYMYVRNLISGLSFVVLIIIAISIFPDHFYIVVLVGLLKIFDLQSDMYYAVPHKKENLDLVGKLMISKHFITLVGFILALYVTRSLILAIIIQLILQVLFLIFHEKLKIEKEYKIVKRNISKQSVRMIIKIGLPLGFVQMIVSFNTSFPRYILEFFESTAVLGYFSAIAYILVIGNLLMNAISQIFLPYLSSLFKKQSYALFRKHVFINLSVLSITLGSVLIITSLIFGEEILVLIYGTEYGNYADILVLMSFALAINCLNWNFDIALLAMRYLSIQFKISVVILVITVVFSFVFIKEFGIYGASFTIIITSLAQLILRIYFVNKKINKHIVNS